MGYASFANVRDQIGACGIWCGSCAIGNGSLGLASQAYFEVLEGHGIEHWAPPELDYAALSNGLSMVSDIAACPGCRQNGGRTECPMRACTAERGFSDCTECPAEDCPNDRLLKHMRTGAIEAGLIVRSPTDDVETLIKEGMATLAARFPCCLLFHAKRE